MKGGRVACHFNPEKHQNKNCGWQNDVKLTRYDRQKPRQQRAFIQGQKLRDIGKIGRYHMAV